MINPIFCAEGESTLTDAMTAAGKTYEEIAQLVAEQVGHVSVGLRFPGLRSHIIPIF